MSSVRGGAPPQRLLLPRLLPSPVPIQPSIPGRTQRKSKANAACNACRLRRTKCDAKRPSCSKCIGRGSECEYVTNTAEETTSQALKRKASELENQKSASEEIFELLRTRPQEEVATIVDRIRAGVDAKTVLRQVHDGDLLLQLSLVPETRYRYEFPYLRSMPKSLRVPSNTYLDSAIFGMAFTSPKLLFDQHSKDLVPKDNAPESRKVYEIPYHAAELVDPLLAHAKVSEWTVISSDNTLLRKLIAAYLMHEWTWWPFIHKDCFLHGLAEGQQEFCSPLLVNAILAAGCQIYQGLPNRNEMWEPQNLGYKFLAEAKRLLEPELYKPKLTTIQATLIIHYRYIENGLDTISRPYLLRAYEMALEMKLFHPLATVDSTRMTMAKEITAWSLFTYQSLFLFHMRVPPLLKEPPSVSLPDPVVNSSWYGDLWLRYPLDTKVTTANFASVFKAFGELCLIMNDIADHSFSSTGNPTKLDGGQALMFYFKLEAWLRGLPDCLSPRKVVLPNQLNLHMIYHFTLVYLFEVLSEPSDHGHLDLDRAPQNIIHGAKCCIETLMRLYYLRHGFEIHDGMIIFFLTNVGYATLAGLSTTPPEKLASFNDLRSTVILCAKGMYDQSRSYFLAEVVFRLLCDQMNAADVEVLKGFVPSSHLARDRLFPVERMKVLWEMPNVSKGADMEFSRVEELMKEYRNLNVDENQRDKNA